MQPLRLPSFAISVKNNSVFCLIRKKWVALTPEEWVRQHFLHLMIAHLNYPKGLIKLEQSMNYFKNVRRSDVTVFERDSNIFMLLECKAPSVKIDQKVISQVSEYNKVLGASHISVSNGIHHFVWRKSGEQYIQLDVFPDYS